MTKQQQYLMFFYHGGLNERPEAGLSPSQKCSEPRDR